MSLPQKKHQPSGPQHSGRQGPFRGRQFFLGAGRDGFGMIQAHSIYGALYFYCYYISSTSDHQALGPRSWGPLPYLQCRAGSTQQRESADQESRQGLRCLPGQALCSIGLRGGAGGFLDSHSFHPDLGIGLGWDEEAPGPELNKAHPTPLPLNGRSSADGSAARGRGSWGTAAAGLRRDPGASPDTI